MLAVKIIYLELFFLRLCLQRLTSVRSRGVDNFFLCTSDRGSNEALARKHFYILTKDMPNTYYFQADCYEHAAHLIVLSGLVLVDQALLQAGLPWKYFTALAITTNVLRSNAKEIYLHWCMLYGAEDANKKVRKLFPRCQSGRWGSVDVTEARFINAGFDRLHAVLKGVAAKSWGKSKKKRQRASDDKENNSSAANLNPNTLALEQTAEYTKRMGQWRAYSLRTSEDAMWGRFVEVVHWSRSPIMWFTHFVRSKISMQDRERYGGHLTQLVNGKANDIFAAFSSKLAANTSHCDL